MTGQGQRFLPRYLLFAATALLTVVVLAGLGYVPTVRIAGPDAVWAMLTGCLVSWIASCVGAVPLALALTRNETQPASAILLSMALRFFVVLVLVVPLALSGLIDKVVTLLWVALSYMLLLVVDTLYATSMVKQNSQGESQ